MTKVVTQETSKKGYKPGRKEGLGSKDTKFAAPIKIVRVKMKVEKISSSQQLLSKLMKDKGREDANDEVEDDANHVVAKVAGGTSQPRQGADSTLLIIWNSQKPCDNLNLSEN